MRRGKSQRHDVTLLPSYRTCVRCRTTRDEHFICVSESTLVRNFQDTICSVEGAFSSAERFQEIGVKCEYIVRLRRIFVSLDACALDNELRKFAQFQRNREYKRNRVRLLDVQRIEGDFLLWSWRIWARLETPDRPDEAKTQCGCGGTPACSR